MKELQGEEQQQFEKKLQELQQKYPQIKDSEARRIFFGSWSEEYYQTRRKQQEEFEEKSKNFPQKLVEENVAVIVGTKDGDIKGPLKSWNQFDLEVETEQGKKRIKKIDCRYLFKAEEEEKFRQGVRLEKVQIPFSQRASFKWIGDDFLMKFKCDQKELIILKTYDGESLMGKVIWYDKYDILFSLTTRIEVLLFRHSIFKFCKRSTLQKKKAKQFEKRKRMGGGGFQKGFRKPFPRKDGKYSPRPYSPSSGGSSGGGGGYKPRKPYPPRPPYGQNQSSDNRERKPYYRSYTKDQNENSPYSQERGYQRNRYQNRSSQENYSASRPRIDKNETNGNTNESP